MSSSSFSCFNLPSYTFFPLLPLSLSLLLPVRTSVYYIHSTCIPLTGHKKPWPWPSIRPSLHPLHYSAGLKYIVFFPNSFASRCAYGIKWMGWDLILIYLPPSSHRNCNERAKVDAASSRTLFLLEHPSQATRLNGGCYWTLLPDGWSTPIQSKTFQFFLLFFLYFSFLSIILSRKKWLGIENHIPDVSSSLRCCRIASHRYWAQQTCQHQPFWINKRLVDGIGYFWI